MPLQITEETKLFLNELIEKKFTSLSILEMIDRGVIEVPAPILWIEEAEPISKENHAIIASKLTTISENSGGMSCVSPDFKSRELFRDFSIEPSEEIIN